jgi:Putative metal-binding motif/Abnormal spindle-like microcephaly-assoc'd, ASPM-SPD-2-Hydin
MRYLLPLFLLACQGDTSLTKVPKELTVSPSLVDFGTIAVGDTVTEELTLTHVAGTEIQVVDLSILDIAGSWFSADESSLPTIDIDGTGTLSIQYAPQEEGYHEARLTVVTDEERDPEHVIDLRGAAAFPSLDIYPPMVDFGPVDPGDIGRASFTIRNSGAATIQLRSLSFTISMFSSAQGEAKVLSGMELEVPLLYTPQDSDSIVGIASIDLGGAGIREVELRANDCEDGEPALYDLDGDGTTSCGGDCDDHEAASAPGIAESCDSLDNNCDGRVDEGTACVDDDGDGATELQGDCNDGDAAVNPSATEDIGNGIDDDCDGVTDRGALDRDGDGYDTGDCDDNNATVFPTATEQPDGLDNDCDGIVDEGTSAYDDDGDGYTEAAGDCDDADPSAWPGATERADGVDDDCNGLTDDRTLVYDDDGDGFTEQGGDCDDADATISPADLEVAGDGVDNDCDGTVQ